MSKEITCPSGLSGIVRGLKGKEAKFLSDRQLIQSGKFIDRILAACWEETIDPGPYASEQGAIDWSKVLVGDRFFALLKIRVETFGADYDFKVQCSNSACRASFNWSVNLETDLPVKKLAQEDAAGFSAGNRLEGSIPWEGDRKKFWFRLHTGADEARMARFRAQQPAITALVLSRIHEIEGVEERVKREFIEEAEFKTLTNIISEMDKHDCGLDTKFEVECSSCYGSTDVELPFAKNFLFPQEKAA